MESEPHSRARTSSPDPRHSRKRRKVEHKQPRFAAFPDGMSRILSIDRFKLM